MANPFTVQPLGGLRSVQNIQNGMAGIAQNYRAGQQEDQQKALMGQAQEVLGRGDPQEIAAFSLQNPDIGKQIQSSVKFKSDETRMNMMQGMQQIIAGGNPEQVLNQRAQFVESQGGDATQTRQEIERFRADPEGYVGQVESSYALMDPEGYTAYRKATSEGGMGGPTPAAIRVFEANAKAAGLEPGTPEYIRAAQIELGLQPRAGISAQERIAGDPSLSTQVAASGAQQAGASEGARLNAQLATKPAIEGAVTTARVTAEGQARSTNPEAQKAIQMEITSARDTIAQIDNLTSNDDYLKAISGIRGKLTPIPGTPGFDAEVAFNQFKDSLTLENLGKMSGVLTDRDIQLLSSAASGLALGMSREALESRLSTIRSVLQSKSESARGKLEGMGGGNESSGIGADIMGMSARQLQALNPADLTDQELKQAADRYNQIGGQ